MSSRSSVFRKGDVAKAIKEVVDSGLPISGVRIDCTGAIEISTGGAKSGASDLDRELEEFQARHGRS